MGNTLKYIRYSGFIKLFYFFVIAILFSSCFTLKSVQIEVLKPAKVVIPSNIQSLTLLNASLPLKSELSKLESTQILYAIDSLVTSELLAYTSNKLEQSLRFTKVVLHNKNYILSNMQQLKPIKADDTELICYQNETDGLLALQGFEFNDTLIRYTIVDEYGYQSGKAFTIICKSLWRLYDPEIDRPVIQRIFTDTIFFNEFDSKAMFWNALKLKQNREWFAHTLANELGFKINETLAPYWVSIRRDMIVGGGEEMQKASDYALADKWKDAAKIWQIMTKHEDSRIASAACYNMALVCEVQGRLDLAIAWLDKSDELYAYLFSENYRSVLKYRITEADLLDKQFGVEE